MAVAPFLFLSEETHTVTHTHLLVSSHLMAFSATSFSQSTFSYSSLSAFPQTRRRNPLLHLPPVPLLIKAQNSTDDQKAQNEKKPAAGDSSNAHPPPPSKLPKKKPVYSMKKGQIVRVDKEKYLNSINYLSVGHPPYYKGLDYIYEDRGEVLDLRIFETGEYALIAWVGIPTAPAWLPTDILIKSERLNYERM